jgi:predicted DNA binding protein
MSTPDTGVTAGTEISFRVQLPDECPLYGRTGEIVSATPHFVDTICRCEFVLRPTNGTEYTVVMSSNPMGGSSCICQDIQDRGAIPIFDRVDGDTLSVATLLDAREDAYALYEDLKGHAPDVEVLRIATDRSTGGAQDRVDVDTTVLTEKQRRALELAVCEGYYCTPREIDLETMAGMLDISRQAFSHRLRQAESKVLSQICPEEYDAHD